MESHEKVKDRFPQSYGVGYGSVWRSQITSCIRGVHI